MLARERHARISQLFVAALELAPERRAAWLRDACAGEEALLVEVASLLDSETRAERVLPGEALGGRLPLTGLLDERELGVDDLDALEMPRRVGRFRVRELIGRGGMGVVYLAEQDHPARTVALKLLRADTFSPARLRRFELEAEILGRLQHRGIAQVYDAGTAETDAGPRPYLALELIRGKPLLEFARGLALAEKLRLGRELCDAVQHAHQHGVIHRDLKPANVLVDETGQPKVLDFGVARADFDASTGATLPGELVGTLPYMAPEQVSGAAHTVDTRCDVYALGLIGFELIAGRSPYDFEGRSWPEIARAIRDDEPLKLGALDRAWRGDLETIFAHALEKDRERRYASAAQLGADVERFLRDEPIAARAPTTLYQLRKFAKRNRVLVAGVAATFVALVLGVAGTSLSLVRAKASEREAERQAKVRAAILDYTTRVLAAPDPSVHGSDVRLIDVLDQLALGLDTGFENDPEVEAGLRSTIGWTLYKLGLHTRAEPHARRAFELRRRTLGMEHVDTLESVTQLTPLLVELGLIDEVEPICREALGVSRRVLGPEAPTTLALEEDEAGILLQRRRFAEAERLIRHVFESRRRAGTPNDLSDYTSLCNLAFAYVELARLPEAEELLREAVEGTTREKGPHHPDTFHARNGLAVVLRKLDRLDEAQELYERLLEDALDQLPRGHVTTIDALSNLSHAYFRAGRLDEAEAHSREALAQALDARGPDGVHIGRLLIDLCHFTMPLERHGEFDDLTRRALEVSRRHIDAEPTEFLDASTSRAWYLSVHDQPREAEAILCAAIDVVDRELPELDPKAAHARYYLVQFLVEQGRFADAEPQLLQCHADRVHRGTVDRRSLDQMIAFYEGWGLPELADTYREQLDALPDLVADQ